MNNIKLLSIPAAAECIGLSRASMYRLITTGRVPVVKIGGRSLVDPTDLAKLIAESKRAAA